MRASSPPDVESDSAILRGIGLSLLLFCFVDMKLGMM